ncbi:MAG: peptide chain release factor N(5)-glutamine methyltransferase [Chitinophagaceae bacterium]
MTMQEATYLILNQIRTIYSEGEASHITDLVMEHLTGSKKTERMLYKNSAITHEEEVLLQQYLGRLLQYEPVQYVLNEAWFFGLQLYVDKNVLIPRPETEELVDWIITNCKFPISDLKIFDIGSGSGCIPIALKKRIRKSEVVSCDISKEALKVAKKNATASGVDIKFIQLDFLDKQSWNGLPDFNLIVSNPPYVPEQDKDQMQAIVLKYEPYEALFVPDNDPLIFYKAIAEFGKIHLNKKGDIYLEIHESQGEATTKLFQKKGYTTELKKDMQGKDRMIKCGLIPTFSMRRRPS